MYSIVKVKASKVDLPLFNGEFGFELDFAIPFAYALYKNNKLNSITCYEGMYHVYSAIFDQNIIFKVPDGKRTECNKVTFKWKNMVTKCEELHQRPNTWLAPNFCGKFKNKLLKLPAQLMNKKDYLIIFNIYNMEWGREPVNYIPNDIMNSMYDRLSKNYNVVIIHPQRIRKGFTRDNSEMFKGFDYGDRTTMDVILDLNPDMNYNLVQMILCDRSHHFISIQGGTSRIASLFGGVNLVLHVEGKELKYNEYESKLSNLSPVDIHIARNIKQLMRKCEELFIT